MSLIFILGLDRDTLILTFTKQLNYIDGYSITRDTLKNFKKKFLKFHVKIYGII